MTLKELADNQTNDSKCCWWISGQGAGKGLKSYFNGFGRIIEYHDFSQNKDKPAYMRYIWEGQIRNGEPYGFNRVIDILGSYSFVGYLNDMHAVQNGTGMYFNDLKLEYSGWYEENKIYPNVYMKPKVTKDFD